MRPCNYLLAMTAWYIYVHGFSWTRLSLRNEKFPSFSFRLTFFVAAFGEPMAVDTPLIGLGA